MCVYIKISNTTSQKINTNNAFLQKDLQKEIIKNSLLPSPDNVIVYIIYYKLMKTTLEPQALGMGYLIHFKAVFKGL